MDASLDRIASTGERPILPDTLMEQPISPKDERIGSANPSPDPAITEGSNDASEPKLSAAGGKRFSFTTNFTPYFPRQQQNVSSGGNGNSTAAWDGYPQHMNADGFNVTPIMFGDNPSLIFQPGFSFNPEGPFASFPVSIPPIMVDGQVYPPHQLPFYPVYYPNMPSTFPSEMTTPQTGNFSPGPGYLLPFGSFGGGNIPGNTGSSPLPSPISYPPQPMGILGSYEQSLVAQRQTQGVGLPPNSSTGQYHHGGSNQSSNFGRSPLRYAGANGRMTPGFDKGRRRERDYDVISFTGGSCDTGIILGPRALKSKGKGIVDLSANSKTYSNDLSGKDFAIDYKIAKFFVIKSFNEDNVHKSIKYKVWSSTSHGNKKLDAAYNVGKEMAEKCPVFLFFSVNASGQFCGLAEMIGPVDFERDADHWHTDTWTGQFPVQWRMIKDVPNTLFRHLILENNDNKPVTHSRDSQEVKFDIGIEMLKIFKDHDARTSLMDDFEYYNERENRMLKGKMAKQLLDDEGKKEIPPEDGSGVEGLILLAEDNAINQISEKISESLLLVGDSDKKIPVMTTDSAIGDGN